MKRKIVKIAACLLLVLLLCLTGCANTVQPHSESVAISSEPAWMADVDDHIGGYEITTDMLSCIVSVNEDYKYSRFAIRDDARVIEFYAAPTEMIITDVNTETGKSLYYREEFDDIDQFYTNPLKRTYEEFSSLDFQLVSPSGKNNEFDVYEAIQTVKYERSEDVRYNLYTFEMDWIDDKHYIFQVYDYADGAQLITADAPPEINPMVVSETNWVIDLDEPCLFNTKTTERIELEFVNVTMGEGPSPNEDSSSIVTEEYCIRVYVNPETHKIEKFQSVRDPNSVDNAEIVILHEPKISIPEITDDMQEMDMATLQDEMMLIHMLESLF